MGLDLESADARRDRARRTWSRAWLRILHWLSLRGGSSGNYIRIYLDRVLSGLRTNPPTLTAPQCPWHPERVLDALQHAFSAHMVVACQTAGSPASLHLSSFAVLPETSAVNPNPANPPEMPYYFSHTSSFHPNHARALMRTRCCSDPFAASATLWGSATRPTHCPPCTNTPHMIEHVLLDCPAYIHIRANFPSLFDHTPPLSRLRSLRSCPNQRTRASFVHQCFEYHQS
jgi:hypothetical protein